MMRRIVTLVVMALVMAAAMLTVAAPAMAARVCFSGLRPSSSFLPLVLIPSYCSTAFPPTSLANHPRRPNDRGPGV